MYCIECGAQIPDNSKFCSHCGKPQTESEPSVKEQVAEKIIENEIIRQIVHEHKNSLDYQFLRKAMGWYLAWVVLHLGLLLIGSNGIFKGGNMGSKYFWPFGKYVDFDEVKHYDITEFLVYSIFPLAILVIWSMVRSQNQDENA
jgi:hypothetical protein